MSLSGLIDRPKLDGIDPPALVDERSQVPQIRAESDPLWTDADARPTVVYDDLMKFWALVVAFVTMSSLAVAKEDVSAAREHYKNGTKLFDLGKYLDAAAEYEAAYEAKDDPSLLFNIAQSYRVGGNKEAALRSYKSFLRRSPEAGNRVAVEGRIGELQRAIDQDQKAKEGQPEGTVRPPTLQQPKGEETVTAVTEPPPVREPEKVPVYKKWWLWTAVAAVVVVGVGVGVGVGVATAPKSFDPTVKEIGPSLKTLVQW